MSCLRGSSGAHFSALKEEVREDARRWKVLREMKRREWKSVSDDDGILPLYNVINLELKTLIITAMFKNQRKWFRGNKAFRDEFLSCSLCSFLNITASTAAESKCQLREGNIRL